MGPTEIALAALWVWAMAVTMFVVLVGCAPFTVRTVGHQARTAPPSSGLRSALESPTQMGGARVLAAEIAPATGPPEPIFEVRIYPPSPASHVEVGPPPRVDVVQVPHPLRTSRLLRLKFSTKGVDGDPARNAWIVISPVRLADPVNWGTFAEPVLQMVQIDTVLPFPAGESTEWQGGAFRREEGSGIIWYQHPLHLVEPLFLQLVVEAPGENSTGFVTSYAHGLIPGS